MLEQNCDKMRQKYFDGIVKRHATANFRVPAVLSMFSNESHFDSNSSSSSQLQESGLEETLKQCFLSSSRLLDANLQDEVASRFARYTFHLINEEECAPEYIDRALSGYSNLFGWVPNCSDTLRCNLNSIISRLSECTPGEIAVEQSSVEYIFDQCFAPSSYSGDQPNIKADKLAETIKICCKVLPLNDFSRNEKIKAILSKVKLCYRSMDEFKLIWSIFLPQVTGEEAAYLLEVLLHNTDWELSRLVDFFKSEWTEIKRKEFSIPQYLSHLESFSEFLEKSTDVESAFHHFTSDYNKLQYTSCIAIEFLLEICRQQRSFPADIQLPTILSQPDQSRWLLNLLRDHAKRIISEFASLKRYEGYAHDTFIREISSRGPF